MIAAHRHSTLTHSPSERRSPSSLARLVWALVGTLALFLGLLGLVLPVFPGAPLVILAGLCFANVSTRLHARLARVPAMSATLTHWERARHASFAVQMKTAAGLVALGTLETLRIAGARLRGR